LDYMASKQRVLKCSSRGLKSYNVLADDCPDKEPLAHMGKESMCDDGSRGISAEQCSHLC
jgi:hypothetical protein